MRGFAASLEARSDGTSDLAINPASDSEPNFKNL